MLVRPASWCALAALGSALAASPVARADGAAGAGGAAGAKSAPVAAPPPEATKPPRPPLPPAPPAVPVPWPRSIEIGGDVAYAIRPASHDGDGHLTAVRLRPTMGFGLHARWNMLEYLRFTAYFVDARHGLTTPPGSISRTPGSRELPLVSSTASVYTYVLGARLSFTIPLGKRARTWLNGGVGWGRLEYPRMTVIDSPLSNPAPFTVRERADSFVEVPFGLGTSFDIVPRWLSLVYDANISYITGQRGEANSDAQAIDALGHKRVIGALPRLDASIVQTWGLALIL